ncbi:OLC1v1010344C1 [Oldenlandia corymbosa var. corymbosa]|uniref:OLC1v1010344C1 n=1 Tax=Oldenlandia corymbosa var. corymbosa TaxID=529605 RepID=A0AAV1DUG5_OLDCO|nr:OLC1v1010344C1 [Oldenlandia corymbosa var. corymbosa]
MVKQIPETFTSTDHYLKSFIYPLLEETRADLYSNLTTLCRAPILEVFDVKISKNFSPPKELYYAMSLKPTSEYEGKEGIYEPEYGDLMAITDVRPKRIDDLNQPKWPYVLALIQGPKDEGSFKLPVLTSKPIDFEKAGIKKCRNENKLFAVYLTNLTTNMRIWKSLNPDPEVANMKILTSVLQVDPNVGLACNACSSEKAEVSTQLFRLALVRDFGLDKSQETAVLNCLDTKDCNHQNTVKLIWGPPGTGKTKTVASLLFALLQLTCRSLTCAPTNVAVIGVINRLMTLLRPTLKYDTYGLGDILLFGNGERMKIDDYEELFDVFLNNRVSALSYCFSPLIGWKGSAEAMIRLLEDPEEQYRLYLNKAKENNEEDNDEEAEIDEIFLADTSAMASQDEADKAENPVSKDSKHQVWRKVIIQTVKENKKKKEQNKPESHTSKHEKMKKDSSDCKNQRKQNNGVEDLLTFEEFLWRDFTSLGNRLIFCITSLYTHMPTSFIQVEVAKDMASVVEMMKALGASIKKVVANGKLRDILYGIESSGRQGKKPNELLATRKECLLKLKILQGKLCLPNLIEDYQIRNFCLQSATLLFCTASGSSKLHTEGMAPIELLIIDEAAQLKECESTVPLQLPGLKHAILIGDQKQLPAMVQSKFCEKAEFGRSLFERLTTLGHPKNLLNVQYRMHPSISLFPNRVFYGKQIKDGPNVRNASYKRSFLKGQMYGSYSFIDINHGVELLDDRHSRKNLVEVYVVVAIIAQLHKQFLLSKQKLRVGCISPYKAQVFELQEKLGKIYSTDVNSDFSVTVRSVDGFQGGEEDIIIISTVRCNGNGKIGFLSDHQRTNVALTRARHCLWILGNSATLINSGSVWKKLVLDAKSRGCFYNAEDDKNLADAISSALTDFRLFDKLFKNDSVLFQNARWKVCFRDEFSKSFAKIQDSEIHKEILSIMRKLSSGWFPARDHSAVGENFGASALLLGLHDLKGSLKLIWTVDIERESSREVQVLKFWEILPGSGIPNIVKRLDELYGNYTMNTLNRCRLRKMEGGLVVPYSWSVETHSVVTTDSLINKLATISLHDEPKPSAKSSG